MLSLSLAIQVLYCKLYVARVVSHTQQHIFAHNILWNILNIFLNSPNKYYHLNIKTNKLIFHFSKIIIKLQ